MVLFVIAVCYDLCTTFRTIFEIMALVDENSVNAQLFKCDHIVLAALIIQLVDLGLQALFRLLHLFDREILRFFSLGFGNAHHDFVNLLFQNGPLALYAHRDLLELRMPDNNGIVVAGGDPAAEFLAVLGFKILAGSDKNIGRRIELQKLSGPLLRQMVGHHKEGFLSQAQPL